MRREMIVLVVVLSATLPVRCRAALGDVVQSFPSPGSWPEGLAWDGCYLWNADGYGCAIYVLEPSTGAVVRSYPSPGSFPEGLAFADGYLYNCDWDTHMIYKLAVSETSLTILESFPTPGERAIGLAWDGHRLWHAAWLWHLYAMARDGSLLNEFTTPDQHPEDLAWDGTNLWLTDWYSATIYRIDPYSGAVTLSFPSPGVRSVGLAFDGRYLWNSDTDQAHSGTIFKIDVGMTELPTLTPMTILALCMLLSVVLLVFARTCRWR
ncbi:glutaminyl-peptide cyclotransferase [bacterium]|nr:glutaminyl-peptide cyclotransferase [candidate division CSSED10-310 bacterium]